MFGRWNVLAALQHELFDDVRHRIDDQSSRTPNAR